MKVSFAVMADAANATKEGKVNLLGAFTVVSTQAVPSHLASCALVVILQPDQEDIGAESTIKLEWVDPDSETLLDIDWRIGIPLDVPCPIPPINIVQGIPALPLAKFGPHEMVIQCPGDTKRISIDVRPVVGEPIAGA